MAQLHQILAVEDDLKNTAKKAGDQAIALFTNRADAFQAWHERFEPLNDEIPKEADKRKELVTTVPTVMDEVFTHLTRFWDAVLQKDATNQEAKAAIVIDGQEITAPLPATFLLGLESKLMRVKQIIEAVPTLDPGVAWDPDPNTGENVYKRRFPGTRPKTKKVPKSEVIVQPVVKDGVGLPAQIEKWSEDVLVGTWTKNEWTGMITPAEKTKLLQRVDTLYQATKKARQKANETEIVNVHTGQKLVDYLLGK
jgi:hypothetical protein